MNIEIDFKGYTEYPEFTCRGRYYNQYETVYMYQILRFAYWYKQEFSSGLVASAINRKTNQVSPILLLLVDYGFIKITGKYDHVTKYKTIPNKYIFSFEEVVVTFTDKKTNVVANIEHKNNSVYDGLCKYLGLYGSKYYDTLSELAKDLHDDGHMTDNELYNFHQKLKELNRVINN